jgi:hypothetical protein
MNIIENELMLWIGNQTKLVLSINFTLILFLFYLNFKEIKRQFREIGKYAWIGIFLIFVFSFHVLLNTPYCDAQDGKFWAYVSVAEIMIHGYKEFPYLINPYTDFGMLKGYGFILGVIFLIFGESYANAILYNILALSATSVLVFMITYLICKDEYSSLISGFVFSVLPLIIYHSKYGSAEISSIFFVTLTILTLIISINLKTKESFVLSLSLLAFSMAIRLEDTMFILLFLISYLTFLQKKFLKKLILPSIIFSLLIFHLIPTLSSASFHFGYVKNRNPPGGMEKIFDEHYPWIKDPASFSLSYIPLNLRAYWDVLGNGRTFPQLLYGLIFISLLGLKKYPRTFIPILWILIFFLFYGSYWASFMGATSLHLLLITSPISILSGIGFSVLYSLFKEKKNIRIWVFILMFLFVLSMFFHTVLFNPEREHLCITKDIITAGNKISKDSCILSENFMWHPYTNLLYQLKFLIKNKKIESDLDRCSNKSTYYIKVPDGIYREYGVKKNIKWYNLRKECNFSEYLDLSTITVYKINC